MPQITITETGKICWQQTKLVPDLKQDDVQVWRVRVPEASATIEQYRKVISIAELDRASRFVQPEDAQRYVAAHVALRQLLSRHTGKAPNQLIFTKNEFGKPALTHDSHAANIHFNLSHSGRFVVIGLSKHPVGVDVENVKNDFNFRNLLPHYFTTAEAQAITRSPSPIDAFFSVWTRKEALGKGLGSGITENMQKLPCLSGTHQSTDLVVINHWKVQTFSVDDEHVASIASSGNVAEMNFFDFKL